MDVTTCPPQFVYWINIAQNNYMLLLRWSTFSLFWYALAFWAVALMASVIVQTVAMLRVYCYTTEIAASPKMIGTLLPGYVGFDKGGIMRLYREIAINPALTDD